jgi:hypothetical protein
LTPTGAFDIFRTHEIRRTRRPPILPYETLTAIAEQRRQDREAAAAHHRRAVGMPSRPRRFLATSLRRLADRLDPAFADRRTAAGGQPARQTV